VCEIALDLDCDLRRLGRAVMRFGLISHEIWNAISWDLGRYLMNVHEISHDVDCVLMGFGLSPGAIWKRSHEIWNQIWSVWLESSRDLSSLARNLMGFGLTPDEICMISHEIWTKISWEVDWDLAKYGRDLTSLGLSSQEFWMRCYKI